MPASAIPLASDFLAGSILSLVLPVAVVVVVTIWYVIMWKRGTGERVEAETAQRSSAAARTADPGSS